MRTGCAEGTPLCETHCKPRSGAAVGTDMHQKQFREAGLTHPADSQWHKSPFGEPPLRPYPPTAAPQSGLQWVSHRGVPSAHPVRMKSVMYFSSKPADFKLYAICLEYNRSHRPSPTERRPARTKATTQRSWQAFVLAGRHRYASIPAVTSFQGPKGCRMPFRHPDESGPDRRFAQDQDDCRLHPSLPRS